MEIVEKEAAAFNQKGRQQKLRGHIEIMDHEGGNTVQLRAYCQRHSVSAKPKSTKVALQGTASDPFKLVDFSNALFLSPTNFYVLLSLF